MRGAASKKERAAFGIAFGRLALAHHIELDDPTMEVYWESLADIPLDRLVPALNHLTIHAAGFFPKPGEIRKTVDALPVQASKALPPVAGALFCSTCDDTGWMETCGGMTRCACYPGNPIYRMGHPRIRRFYDDRHE